MNKIWILALAATCMFTSCMEDDDAGKPMNGTLQVSLTGLSDLGPNYRYQAWVVKDGIPMSAGVFSVDATGMLSRKDFPVKRTDLMAATQLMVTVEPFPDTDTAPSTVKVMAGEFASSNAELSTNHPDILGVSFNGLSANYVLSSPTTPETTDETRGLWFAKISDGTGYSPGLTMLPPLSEAWRYEAWVVLNGQPVSMGKFQAADRADQSNRFGGSGAGLSFPGEDFIANAPAGLAFPQSLAGSQVMISIEPLADTNLEAPFIMQPFKGQVQGNALAHTNYTLASQSEQSMPQGTATR